MTTIFHDDDADLAPLAGASVAVIGYGNQGRSWALNLRDSGFDVAVCVRADASRDQAVADGFDAGDLSDASTADVVCVLVPDDVIPSLPLGRPDDGLTIVASGYTLAFDRFDPTGGVGMVAPRMLGPEVRRCYEEGIGFITAVGVHRDATGRARERTLAVAKAIGGLRQGAVELTPMQEAVLDLAVEQALSPALTSVHTTFVQVMLEQGIPLEAVLTELILSGEVERTMRLVRESGYAAQFGFHSPTSQYGQLTRRGAYDHLDLATTMRRLVDDIASGRFADEWDAERDAGYPQLTALREQHAGPAVEEFETALRRELGEGAPASRPLLRSLFERCRVELPGDSRRSLDPPRLPQGQGPLPVQPPGPEVQPSGPEVQPSGPRVQRAGPEQQGNRPRRSCPWGCRDRCLRRRLPASWIRCDSSNARRGWHRGRGKASPKRPRSNPPARPMRPLRRGSRGAF